MSLRSTRRVSCVWLLSLAVMHGQQQQQLPIRRVVLYKNGVGYFEHVGQVRGNQVVTIPFTSGQLNDALKSLTLLDLNGGRITSVEYASSAPVDRQLGDLRLPGADKATLTEFLGALRGAKLEVRAGGSAAGAIAGRLLSVERKTRVAGGNTLEVDYISLLTESGELRTTEVSPSFQVRLLDGGLPGKVNRMLDLVSLSREPDLRNMVVSTQGEGERRLYVSYISEVPVWKATYRVVLNQKNGKSPLIQGWAIVDNTVGQNWENVELSLVAGAPQSFIQELSQPYYSRRPVVALPEQAMSTPQTFEATLYPGGGRLAGTVYDASGGAVAGASVKVFAPNGALMRTTMTGPQGTYELSGLSDGTYRVEFEAAGFNRTAVNGLVVAGTGGAHYDARLQLGTVAQTVEVSAAAAELQTTTASMTRVGGRSLGSGAGMGRGGTVGGVPGGVSGGSMGGVIGGIVGSMPGAAPPPAVTANVRAALRAAAGGQELGDLFEYKLKDPITIQKNRSALVPIVNAAIAAEKVSVWNDAAGQRRPIRALWLENTSGLTLDAGSFSVLEEETFAGEGIFEPIRPGEKRLISYAVDLAVNTNSRNRADSTPVSRCVISKGVMLQESALHEKKTYVFRNEDSSARTILVEHAVRPGFQLVSREQPAEIAAGWMRFRVPVPSKQTVEFTIEESKPLEARFGVNDLTAEQITAFLAVKAITPEIEAALRRILAQKTAVAAVEAQKEAREADQNKIFDDQQRLRENMKSLKGSAEEKALLQRYTQQLGQQETQLENLRKEIAALTAAAEKQQEALEEMIAGLAFDVKLI